MKVNYEIVGQQVKLLFILFIIIVSYDIEVHDIGHPVAKRSLSIISRTVHLQSALE